MKKNLMFLSAVLVLNLSIVYLTVFSGYATPRKRLSVELGQSKQKKLSEIAKERDVEIEGLSGCEGLDMNLADLRENSKAIIYGRIFSSKSYFDDSGGPEQYGEIITSEYIVEVLRVIRDRTSESLPAPDKPPPSPLITPLKIARNGGFVFVNGHRASVKVKGYEDLSEGQQYVFFLNWSPSYKAYNLTGCILGAIHVSRDRRLKTLGSSKTLGHELEMLTLEGLVTKIR
ncbi:MAG: hypothetical protein ACT4OT_12135 [Acidobacteriota bacterium]